MIRTAHIRNFKGFDDLDVEGLKRITLIGGKNSIGKTSLMEAFFLLFARNNHDSFIKLLGLRNVASVALTADRLWAPAFHDFDLGREMSISLIDEEGVDNFLSMRVTEDYRRELKLRPGKDGQVDSGPVNTMTRPEQRLKMAYGTRDAQNEVQYQVIEGNSLTLEPGEQAAFKPQATTALFFRGASSASKDAIQRFSDLDKSLVGTADIIKEIRETIEPRLEGLSIQLEGEASMLYCKLSDMPVKMPINYMGDGIIRVLNYLLGIHSSSRGVVLIDEIENGIHHKAMPKVLLSLANAAKKNGVQVFATTHSYECLQAAVQALKSCGDDELKQEVSYVRLQRDAEAEDKIVTRVYDWDMFETAIKHEMELR